MMITAVDLCKDCLIDPMFTEKAEFVDKKVIPRKKLNTKTVLNKTISQRKNELKQLEVRKGEILNIADSLKKLPKLTEYYMDFTTLSEELNRLYGMYFDLLENRTKKIT